MMNYTKKQLRERSGLTQACSNSVAVAVLVLVLGTVPAMPLHAQEAVAAPHINTISPALGMPGSRATITGAGFTASGNIVTFQGATTAKLILASRDRTTLNIDIPFITPGSYQVFVRTGDQRTTNIVSFTVVPRGSFVASPVPQPVPSPSFAPPAPTNNPVPPTTGAPVVTNIEPARVEQAAHVTIHGYNFTRYGNRIEVSGPGRRQIILVSSLDTTTLSFAAPVVPNGIYQVVVINSQSLASNPVTLEIQHDPIVLPIPRIPIPRPPLPSPSPCFFGGVFCRPTLTYVALGDSVARGLSAFQGYVARYEDLAETTLNRSINDRNFAQNGWTSTDLRNALRGDINLRNAVAAADIVTWNIGGNDLRVARSQYQSRTCGGTDNQDCLRTAVTNLKTNFTEIAHLMSEITRNPTRPSFLPTRYPSVIMRSMDLYYPYVDEDRSRDSWPGDTAPNDFVVLKPYLDDVNAHIALALGQQQIPYARVYDAFNGPNHTTDPATLGYISFDEYHPNDRGHARIAELLHQIGYADLRIPNQPTFTPRPTTTPLNVTRVESLTCLPNQLQLCLHGRCFCNTIQIPRS